MYFQEPKQVQKPTMSFERYLITQTTTVIFLKNIGKKVDIKSRHFGFIRKHFLKKKKNTVEFYYARMFHILVTIGRNT